MLRETGAVARSDQLDLEAGTPVSFDEANTKLEALKSNENPVETFERVTAHLEKNDLKPENLRLRLSPELTFDPATLTFPGNGSANEMLTREYRKPFVVPPANEV